MLLLGVDMSKSEDDVNRFIDDNCYWEWGYETNPKEIESRELSSPDKCYPLNIQGNKTVCEDIIKRLKKLRKTHKK